MDPTLSDEENIEILQALFSIGPVEARQFLAMEKGRSQGDVIEEPAVEPPAAPAVTPPPSSG